MIKWIFLEMLLLGAYYSSNTSESVVQSDFVLWSTDNNQKLVQVACGGGHRTWDCCIHGNAFQMVYLKARDIVLCKGEMWRNQFLLKVKGNQE